MSGPYQRKGEKEKKIAKKKIHISLRIREV